MVGGDAGGVAEIVDVVSQEYFSFSFEGVREAEDSNRCAEYSFQGVSGDGYRCRVAVSLRGVLGDGISRYDRWFGSIRGFSGERK
jgi:hypothetical protein